MNLKQNRLVMICLMVLFGLLCSSLLEAYNHDATNDFNNFFYPAARNWLNGSTRLYDENSRVFFNAPWHMVILAPFAAFPEDVAYILHTFVSLGALIIAVRFWTQEFAPPRWAVYAGLLNLSTFALLYAGQMDTLLLVGASLGYWSARKHRPLWLSVALALLTIKPQNVVLPILFLVYSARSWSLSEKLKAISVPVGLLVAFTFVIGLDWPLRYIENIRVDSPVGGPERTMWGLATRFDVSFLLPAVISLLAIGWFFHQMTRWDTTACVFCLALATNLFVSPYVHLHHYVVLIIPLLYVARQNARFALIAIVALWTPLLNLIAPDTLASGVLYQFVLYGAVVASSLSLAPLMERSATHGLSG